MKIVHGEKLPIKENEIGLRMRGNYFLLVDTREQKPYWTGGKCAKAPLIVGDYTTNILLNKFHVDRKSPGDLYQTITTGHSRFKREILRAEKENITLVIFVECSMKNFVEKNFLMGEILKYPSSGLQRIVDTLQERYALEFVWCDSRKHSQDELLKRLEREHKQLKIKR